MFFYPCSREKYLLKHDVPEYPYFQQAAGPARILMGAAALNLQLCPMPCSVPGNCAPVSHCLKPLVLLSGFLMNIRLFCHVKYPKIIF